MSKRRNTRRQYEYTKGQAQELVVAGPSDGVDRLPDMTEREAEAIMREASLYPRTARSEVKPTVDTKGRVRGFIVFIRRDDGMQLMVGSRQQWPDVRRSLVTMYLP